MDHLNFQCFAIPTMCTARGKIILIQSRNTLIYLVPNFSEKISQIDKITTVSVPCYLFTLHFRHIKKHRVLVRGKKQIDNFQIVRSFYLLFQMVSYHRTNVHFGWLIRIWIGRIAHILNFLMHCSTLSKLYFPQIWVLLNSLQQINPRGLLCKRLRSWQSWNCAILSWISVWGRLKITQSEL